MPRLLGPDRIEDYGGDRARRRGDKAVIYRWWARRRSKAGMIAGGLIGGVGAGAVLAAFAAFGWWYW